MLNPFSKEDLHKPGFIRKLLNKQLVENFRIEINNLLAQKQPLDINITELNQIRNKYQIQSNIYYNWILSDFYYKALSRLYHNRNITSEERIYLNSLYQLLELDPGEVERLEKSFLFEIFSNKFFAIPIDDDLSQESKDNLLKIGKELNLKEAVSKDFYYACAMKKLADFVKTTDTEEELTLDQVVQLEKLAGFYDVPVPDKSVENNRLSGLNLTDELLKPIPSQVNLQKNEVCYHSNQASYSEFLRTPQRMTFNGMTAKSKIAGGFYWRSSDIGLNKIKDEELKHIDSGILSITNKRLIFKGSNKVHSLALFDILDFALFSNGVVIHKENGKNLVYLFEDVISFSMCLSAVLEEI
ncbi:MAG: hypothetical protein JXR56_03475 [Candidatus Cloacimonetes bacterium]|nr:hypothetical protein [Candidatus Cloacimonadota bacterium]